MKKEYREADLLIKNRFGQEIWSSPQAEKRFNESLSQKETDAGLLSESSRDRDGNVTKKYKEWNDLDEGTKNKWMQEASNKSPPKPWEGLNNEDNEKNLPKKLVD